MSDNESTGPIRGLDAARGAVADFVRGRRVALATGGCSWTACGAERAFADALASAAAVRRVIHAGDLLSLAELDDVRASLVDFEPECFLAVGGGAAMDSAKLLALSAGTGHAPSELAGGVPVAPRRPPPLFAVPTTAGTGAEATHFAVAYAGRTKKSIGHPSVRPSLVALVPEFTATMTPYQTACTGFDAISQSIESLWARGATDESRAFARRALDRLDRFDAVLAAPDAESRAAMQEGAYWSGRAIDVSKTTAAHALSYFLTANYGVPHGHAVAMAFPYVARWNLSHAGTAELARLCERFDPRRVAALQTLPDFCRARGLDFRALCADLLASADPARGSNNPAPLPLDPDELFAGAD